MTRARRSSSTLIPPASKGRPALTTSNYHGDMLARGTPRGESWGTALTNVFAGPPGVLNSLQAVMVDCFNAWQRSSLVRQVVQQKLSFYNAGLWWEKIKQGETSGEPLEAVSGQKLRLDDLMADAWLEFLRCDNIPFVFTDLNMSDPIITIADCCHIVETRSGPGKYQWKLSPTADKDGERKVGMPPLKDATGPGLAANSTAQEPQVHLEHAGKRGAPMQVPGLWTVILDVMGDGMVQAGEFAARGFDRKPIRQWKKGHKIENGALAGTSLHFVQKKQVDALKAFMKEQTAAVDLFSNFDLEAGWIMVPREYYEDKATAGLLKRLSRWAGPLLKIETASNQEQASLLRDALEAEGRQARWEMKQIFLRFQIERGLNPLFVPHWSPAVFWSSKTRETILRNLVSNGIISAPTMQEEMGYHRGRESARMQTAKKEAETQGLWTPIYEANQGGMGRASEDGTDPTTGGRPPTAPD